MINKITIRIKEIILSYYFPVCFFLAAAVYHLHTPFWSYYAPVIFPGIILCVYMLFNIKKYANWTLLLVTFALITSALTTFWDNRWDIYGHIDRLLDYEFHVVNASFVFFLAYFMIYKNPKRIDKIMQKMSLMIFASVIYSYIEFIYRAILLGEGIMYRVEAFWANPIPAAAIWIMGLWLPLAFNSKKLDFALKLLYIPPIFLSQCRNAWLGLVFILIVAVVKYNKAIINAIRHVEKKLIVLGTAIIAIVLAVSSNLIIGILVRRFSNISSQQGYYARVTYIKYSIEQIFNSDIIGFLFGYGWDSSSDMIYESPIYIAPYPLIDNSYLTAFYEKGLAMMIVILCVVTISFVVLKKHNEPRYAIALISCYIPSFFYDVQKLIAPMYIISVCAGIVCAQLYLGRNNGTSVEKN